MSFTTRRIVTGHDAQGRASVQSERQLRAQPVGIVLAGEIDLELDQGRIVSLNVGDVVVQRGTNHAWINRGSSPARMAFVLLSAAALA